MMDNAFESSNERSIGGADNEAGTFTGQAEEIGLPSADYSRYIDDERQMAAEVLSFYSASENEHGDDDIWGLLSGVCGNIFEW
jgi:hypothetical protein